MEVFVVPRTQVERKINQWLSAGFEPVSVIHIGTVGLSLLYATDSYSNPNGNGTNIGYHWIGTTSSVCVRVRACDPL